MTTDTVELKIGSRWASVTCDTEVIVVAAPSAAVVLECGGAAMVPKRSGVEPGRWLDPAHAAGTVIGKRYEDPASDLEVLCTKAGAGSLSVDGRPLQIKQPKQLPSSD